MERLHVPKCVVNMENRLAALRHDQEIDGLRVYLIKYNLFPHSRDPHTSPIRVEELKELIKHWKLHRQRGFWRDHPEKEDLVRALLQHIKNEALNRKRRQEAHDKYRAKFAPTAALANVNETDIVEAELVGKEYTEEEANAHEEAFTKRYQFAKSVGKDDVRRSKHTEPDEKTSRMAHLNKSVKIAKPWLDKTSTSEHPEISSQANEKLYPSLRTSASCPAIINDKKRIYMLSKEMKLKCAQGLHSVSCFSGAEAQLLHEGACSAVIVLAKVEDPIICLYCAATLYNMTAARNRELYIKMMEEGVLTCIHELCRTAAIKHWTRIQFLCARMLLRFSSDDVFHIRMIQEGGIAALCQMISISSSTDEIRRLCMSALINLALTPHSIPCDIIVSTFAGIMKSLQASSSGPDMLAAREDTYMQIAQGILNLSILPSTRSSIVKEGVMPPVIQLFESGSIKIREKISLSICNLAGLRGNQETMVKQGAVSILSDLIRGCQERAIVKNTERSAIENVVMDSCLVPLILRNSILALAHYCCHTRLKHKIVVIPSLLHRIVAVLEKIHIAKASFAPCTEEIERYCVIILANLAMEERCRPCIFEAKSVSILLRIVKSSSASVDLKLDCVMALSYLMLQPDNFHRIVREGVIPTFLELICRKSSCSQEAEIQCACMQAMLHAARDRDIQKQLTQPESTDAEPTSLQAIPSMLAFAIQNLSNSTLCSLCLEFFCELSARKENDRVLFAHSVHEFLCDVLTQKLDLIAISELYGMRLIAVRILCHLAKSESESQKLLEHRVIQAINYAIAHVSGSNASKQLKLEGLFYAQVAQLLHSLLTLSSGTETEQITHRLLLPSLFSVCKYLALYKDSNACPKRQQAIAWCALTFAKLCSSPTAQGACARSLEILPILNMLLRTMQTHVQLLAILSFCNLTSVAKFDLSLAWQDVMIKEFIVRILLRVNERESKWIGAKTIFNLLTLESKRRELIEYGALFALSKLVMSLRTVEMYTLLLRAIYNLSLPPFDATDSSNKVILTIVRDMEIVKMLKSLETDGEEMKELVCGILSNITAWSGFQKRLLSDGLLLLLQSLLSFENDTSLLYIANAYHNLVNAGGASLSDVVSILFHIDNGCILTILVSLMQTQIINVQRCALKTLAHLSGYSMALVAMSNFHSDFCALLNVFLKTPRSAEMAQDCVFILRNLLSFSTENQSRYIACDGVPTLATLLSSENMVHTSMTLGRAAEIACRVANVESIEGIDSQQKLVRDGIVKVLHSIAKSAMFSSESNEDMLPECVVLQVLTALVKLSQNPACHEGMLGDGVLETLVLFFRAIQSVRAFTQDRASPPAEDFAMYCAMIIRNLARKSSSSQSLSRMQTEPFAAQPLIVALLMAISQCANAQTLEHIAIVLHNLSLIPDCRRQILRSNGVKHLLRLGISPPATAIKRHICSLTLQRLAVHEKDNVSANTILQKGIVNAISLLGDTHQHQESIANTAEALSAIVYSQQDKGILKRANQVSMRSDVLQYKSERAAVLVHPTQWEPSMMEMDNEFWTQQKTQIQAMEVVESDEVHLRISDGQTADKPIILTQATPRTCNVEEALGAFQMLQDSEADKITLEMELSEVQTALEVAEQLPQLPKGLNNRLNKIVPLQQSKSVRVLETNPKQSTKLVHCKSIPQRSEIMKQNKSAARHLQPLS